MKLFAAIEADIIALFLIWVMVFYGKIQERKRRERNVFNRLLLSNVVLCISDIGMWTLEGLMFPGALLLLNIVSLIHNCSLICIAYLWLLYTDLQTMEKRRGYKKRRMFYALPGVFLAVLNVINLWTGWICYYDDQCMYCKGDFFVVYSFFSILYLLLSIVVIFIAVDKGEKAKARDAYALLGFLTSPTIILVVQNIVGEVSLVPFGITISLLMIFLQRIIAMITKDHLTGLDNQRSFERTLSERVRSSNAQGKLFVMMIDGNSFKFINDTYGHDAGDEALVRIANAMRRSAESQDYLARLGGDEFVIIGSRDKEDDISALTQKINYEMQRENNAVPYTLTVSMGYDIFDHKKHKNGTGLYKSADAKMYENKRKYHEERK